MQKVCNRKTTPRNRVNEIDLKSKLKGLYTNKIKHRPLLTGIMNKARGEAEFVAVSRIIIGSRIFIA